jgi:hypothetical protein
MSSAELVHCRRYAGWTSFVFSLVGPSLLAFTGDAPPFMYYLMPIVMGILLLRRSPVPSEQDERKKYAFP